MALPTGLRPRSAQQRLALAHTVVNAPRAIAVLGDEDGWICAQLRIAGRLPIWRSAGPREAAEAVLARLGLPGLAPDDTEPDALLHADFRLETLRKSAWQPLPAVDGPLVSILICTYNRKDLLPQAIASARAQRWPCEILVVNDGSTDGTAELLDRTPGIRVFHKPNGGKPTALNLALQEMHGEALLVLDDDDLLLPGALHVLGRALFDHPELSAVWADTTVFRPHDGSIEKEHVALRGPGEMARGSSLYKVPSMPGATLVSASAQRAAGPYDLRLFRGQDIDMFQRLAATGPIESLPFCTFLYRSHDGLRGPKGAQWRLSDGDTHRQKFLSFVQPVFRERWEHAAPATRGAGFDWALGLVSRELFDEARLEVVRWPGPYDVRESIIRTRAGVPTTPDPCGEALLVVDDGDAGALEATLRQHARDPETAVPRAVEGTIFVPRDPFEAISLEWPGHYTARSTLAGATQHAGPWHLRWTSAPDWAPPPVQHRAWLPDVPAREALILLAAAWDLELPARTRGGLPDVVPDALARAARDTRSWLREGDPGRALTCAMVLVEGLPGWVGTWTLAAEALRAAGSEADARSCDAQGAALLG